MRLRKFQGLLGPKKELWDILQLVEKYCPEAQDMTSSIRDLPTVRYGQYTDMIVKFANKRSFIFF